MDPFTLATGASSLTVTAAKISGFLYEAFDSSRSHKLKPDQAVTSLSSEIGLLNDFLESVDKTLRDCHIQALALAHVDDSLWHPIGNTMMDCKATLEALDNMLSSIRTSSQTNLLMFRRSNIHAKVAERLREIEGFTNKVYKSNCALQVVLGVIRVSLSLRTAGHRPQDFLYKELGNLQTLIEHALRVAHSSGFGSDPFAAQISRNLLSLAKAANRFHVHAGTTAGTIYGGTLQSNWGGSESGGLTEFQRERIERWNQLQPVQESGEADSNNGAATSTSQTTSAIGLTPDQPYQRPSDEGEGSDPEMDFDLVRNFEELAQASFDDEDHAKAEQYLRKAIERSAGEGRNGEQFRLLILKLAVCCGLQEKWEAADEALIPIVRSKSPSPSSHAIFHLLHVIAVAHLLAGRLDEACEACKSAVQGWRRLSGRKSDEFYDSLRLLAEIYDKRGDSLEAEAVRHSLAGDWKLPHDYGQLRPREYLLVQPRLAGVVSREVPNLVSSVSPPPASHQAIDEPVNSQSPGLSETHTGDNISTQPCWQLPKILGDGVSQVDLLNRQLGELDTGKELVLSNPRSHHEDRQGVGNLVNAIVVDTHRVEGLKQLFHGMEKRPSWFSGSSATGADHRSSNRSPPMSVQSAFSGTHEPQPHHDVRTPLVIPRSSGIKTESSDQAASFSIILSLYVDGAYISVQFDQDNVELPNSLKISRTASRNTWSVRWSNINVTTISPGKCVPADSCPPWSEYSVSFLRLLESSPKPTRVTPDGYNSDGEKNKKVCRSEDVIKSCIMDLATTFWATFRDRLGLDVVQRCREGPVTFRLPDQAIRHLGISISSLLAGTGLVGSVTSLPHSLAIATHFLCSQVSPEPNERQAVIVFQCGAIVVETASFLVRFPQEESDEDSCELVELESPTTVLLGRIHVEKKLEALVKLKVSQYFSPTTPVSELDQEKLVAVRKSCIGRLLLKTMRSFIDDGRSWRLDLEPTTTMTDAAIEFSNDEIKDCFESTVRRVRKTLEIAILRAGGLGHRTLHVILSGSFSTSKMLIRELRTVCTEHGSGPQVSMYEYGTLRLPSARVEALHNLLRNASVRKKTAFPHFP